MPDARLTLARPPLASHLDLIKFICKDLFLYVYGKQIDNLRTNHRGIFVLQSHSFPPLSTLSGCSASPSNAASEAAKAHLIFHQALVQGALARLGMPCTVTAESAHLPQCECGLEGADCRYVSDPGCQGPTPGEEGELCWVGCGVACMSLTISRTRSDTCTRGSARLRRTDQPDCQNRQQQEAESS